MATPHATPMCEHCRRRFHEQEAVLPHGTVVRWTGCFCDAPSMVHNHWESLGSKPLPRHAGTNGIVPRQAARHRDDHDEDTQPDTEGRR